MTIGTYVGQARRYSNEGSAPAPSSARVTPMGSAEPTSEVQFAICGRNQQHHVDADVVASVSPNLELGNDKVSSALTIVNTMSSATPPPNIYIIGPQSTGKTTLVNKIRSESFHQQQDQPFEDPQIISEVARSVLIEHKFTANDITSSQQRCLTLQRLILEAQAKAEDTGLGKSSWFISDRSGIDPLVYARRYASKEGVLELQQLDAWTQIRARMMKSLIVVCESGTPWLADDGVRLMPRDYEEWFQLFGDFCAILDELGLRYSVVPRSMLNLSERAEFVRQSWLKQQSSCH